MLAGRMKLNHFIALVVVVGGTAVAVLSLGGGAALMALLTGGPDPEPTPTVNAHLTVQPTPSVTPSPDRQITPRPEPRTPAAVEPDSSGRTLRPDERFVMDWEGRNLGSKKRKDATKGAPWKVNLYQDDGSSTVNRAKVDLDRDDQWDLKYTFASDGITRKTSTADDGNYDLVERWSDGGWQAE